MCDSKQTLPVSGVGVCTQSVFLYISDRRPRTTQRVCWTVSREYVCIIYYYIEWKKVRGQTIVRFSFLVNNSRTTRIIDRCWIVCPRSNVFLKKKEKKKKNAYSRGLHAYNTAGRYVILQFSGLII